MGRKTQHRMIQREFSGEADRRAMAVLVHGFPACNLHVADLPYRFSSWAFDCPDNVGLWVDAEGQLLAWAVMQTPFWTIDYACHPGADSNLHRQLLAWADRRARRVLDTSSGRPAWFVNVFADQMDRIRDLEEAGFASQADVGDDSWSKVLMQRSAQTPVDYTLPVGFTIRPLAGESEVGAYVELHRAVFESRNMTVEWRARTLRHPEYILDLDLVAVAPDGRLAAFCVCWLNKNPGEGARGQIEPLGVRADFRKLGLGWAILAEGLRRLQLYCAGRIYVETDNYRNAAFELYESAGFQVVQDVLVYRKDYV
ncbi:MAG: GNAT family N-acetyltransferase [Anaerolineae bacterium]|nr:GNAT family N-acetyltransferase [Anaerolineae bacterium]